MNIIRNRRELATTGLRGHVLDIVEAGIGRVLPAAIMESAVAYDPGRRTITLSDYECYLDKGRVFVIGGGKASGSMAEALERIVTPDNITAGIVTCKGDIIHYRTKIIEVIGAGHPFPDERGAGAVQRMLALKHRYSIDENDLVICLISGGGSALLPCPVEGVSLDDKRRVTGLLLNCGAEITEINTVRKHLSGTKGGRLGQFYSPAKVVSLILSDVVGNSLEVIASGPTIPDQTTFADAWGVLDRYDLLSATPDNVLNYLQKGCRGEVPETPEALPNCHNFVIGDNRLALEAMIGKAEKMGLTSCLVTAEQTGNTVEVARYRAGEILNGKYSGYDIILIGGETTLSLPPDAGRGGRNQHYALESVSALKDYAGEWVLTCVGTDGSDFLPDIAGAIADNNSLASATDRGIDLPFYLNRFDSNTALDMIGHSLIVTGDTGTNVGDIIVYALR